MKKLNTFARLAFRTETVKSLFCDLHQVAGGVTTIPGCKSPTTL